MAKITQARKRKPIHDGEINSIGASSFIDGKWKAFSVGFIQYDDEGESVYTSLWIDRAEAERIVTTLNDYLNGKH